MTTQELTLAISNGNLIRVTELVNQNVPVIIPSDIPANFRGRSLSVAKFLLSRGYSVGWLICRLMHGQEWARVWTALEREGEFKFLYMNYPYEVWANLADIIRKYPPNPKSIRRIQHAIFNQIEVPISLRAGILRALFLRHIPLEIALSTDFHFRILARGLISEMVDSTLECLNLTPEELFDQIQKTCSLPVYRYLVDKYNLPISQETFWNLLPLDSRSFQLILFYYPEISDEDLLIGVGDLSRFEKKHLTFNQLMDTHDTYRNLFWLAETRPGFSSLLARRVFSDLSSVLGSKAFLDQIIKNDGTLLDDLLQIIREQDLIRPQEPVFRNPYYGMISVLKRILSFGNISQLERAEDLYLRYCRDVSILEGIFQKFRTCPEYVNVANWNWYQIHIPFTPEHLYALASGEHLETIRNILSSLDSPLELQEWTNTATVYFGLAVQTSDPVTAYHLSKIWPDLEFPEDIPSDICMYCKDQIQSPFLVCKSSGKHSIHVECWDPIRATFGSCLICKAEYSGIFSLPNLSQN